MPPFLARESLATLLLAVAVVATIALGAATTMVARRALLRLSVDSLEAEPAPLSRTRSLLRTVAGVALAGAGGALLVLPGPGLVLIVLGVLMLDTRWRRRLVRRILVRPRVLGAINDLRRRHGEPELVFSAAIGER